MRTRALKALAGVICAAQNAGRRTPMGIATAVEDAGMLMDPETAAELERLRGQASAEPQALSSERLAVLRMARTHCEADQYESQDERPLHVWGPSQYPTREMCQRCTVSREWAEDADADEVVLVAEVDRLRERVAVLEQQNTTETRVHRSSIASAEGGDR